MLEAFLSMEIVLVPLLMSELKGNLVVIWPNSLDYKYRGRD